MTAPETPAETRVFNVLLSRKDSVEAGLLGLQKRAARKGLPTLAWSWGKAYAETVVRMHDGGPSGAEGVRVGNEEKIKVTRIPLTLATVALKFAGWTFVAALQHMDGENIVRTVGNVEMPVSYRTRGPACDHCGHDRRRNDTYVLFHAEANKFVQVGSTCIEDFLGGEGASALAARACLLADACGLGEGGEEGGFGGGGSGSFMLAEYLPFVAWDVRTLGWVSRSVARDQGKLASADNAWIMMTDQKKCAEAKCEPSAEDIALAAAAEVWAESLLDPIVGGTAPAGSEGRLVNSDYLHNLRVVARSGLVAARTCGIAASMVTAYQRFLGDERKRAERAARPSNNVHVGTVGKRETFVATLDFVTGYDTNYGYTTVLKFLTEPSGAEGSRVLGGETIVWKASSTEIGRADVGKRFEVTGMVKKHDEYKGQKQTMMNRCKLTELAVEEKAKESA